MTALRQVTTRDIDPEVQVALTVSSGSDQASAPIALDLAQVLQVLGDPVRLAIVKQLADGTERSCGEFDLPVSKSTCSHHLRVLRECGLIETRTDGKSRQNRLRCEALEVHLPGLLAVILKATE